MTRAKDKNTKRNIIDGRQEGWKKEVKTKREGRRTIVMLFNILMLFHMQVKLGERVEESEAHSYVHTFTHGANLLNPPQHQQRVNAGWRDLILIHQ